MKDIKRKRNKIFQPRTDAFSKESKRACGMRGSISQHGEKGALKKKKRMDRGSEVFI